jgi:hypothetical protein
MGYRSHNSVVSQHAKFTRRFFVFVLFTLISTPASWAFDGNRKGIVFGGGFGYGPVATFEYGDTYQKYSGLGTNLMAGYGLDERNIIVFLDNGIWHDFKGTPVVQGFSGLAWFHHLNATGPTLLFGAGAGLQAFTSFDKKYRSKDFGVGVAAATGYEFKKHFMIYGSVCWGETADANRNFSHLQIQIGLSALAY